MTCTVGDQGEIVIEKELRDQLGIRPGWIALQRLVDNRIEIQFTPPAHDKSLKGSLAEYATEDNAFEDKDWQNIKENAWAKAIEEEADQSKAVAFQHYFDGG